MALLDEALLDKNTMIGGDAPYTITLANGNVFKNLQCNGLYFISASEITEDQLSGKISPVTFQHGSHTFVVDYMAFKEILHPTEDEWWMRFETIQPDEVKRLATAAKMDYLSMMTGVDLDL